VVTDPDPDTEADSDSDAEPDSDSEPEPELESEPEEHPLVRGMRSAVRNDASAYSYSILITTSFGAVQLEVGSATIPRLFFFVLGATGAFAVVEAASSRFFRKRIRQDPGEVVVLGTALAPVSVGVALAAGLALLQVVGGSWAWALTPGVVTATYIAMAAIQLTLARQYEERHPPDA
jgi:hypothetical protein